MTGRQISEETPILKATTQHAIGDATVEAARHGDPDAWHHIVTELGPVLRGFARARGAADPDDATQEVFVAAATRIGEFVGDARSFRSWLFSIAYRQVVNQFRRASRDGGALPVSLIDPAPHPDEAVVEEETRSEALAAMDVLTPQERDVVLMRVLAELDTPEVAAALGTTTGNVRVIQSRAMAKLREELARRGYGEEQPR